MYWSFEICLFEFEQQKIEKKASISKSFVRISVGVNI